MQKSANLEEFRRSLDQIKNQGRRGTCVAFGTADQLATLLEETLQHSRKVISSLAEEDLGAIRRSNRDGESYTVAWCLAHALEHTGLHLGHIQLTCELWGTAPGGRRMQTAS